MAATGIAVSVSMGALKPVLQKLPMLLGDKYKELKDLQKEVPFLMKELGEMKALLEKMDAAAADELDLQAKNWRKDIIDMSYDIEDCIDDFMDHVGEANNKGVLKKVSSFLRTIKDRCRIASQIKEIKTRVIEASKRRDRYTLNVCTSSSTTKVLVDPRLSALYNDSAALVGIDSQKEDLVKWVENEEKHLKVMPIVGFGGLGKTTLANEVYHEVKGRFNSKAFVSVSQKPDVPRLLSSVCSKLGLSPSSSACEVQELIDALREHLSDKRYLIVVDDLWDVPTWNLIKSAFPKNGKQSRVIVTTRHQDVAMSCSSSKGDVHDMKLLSDQHSRTLFNNRIFGPEGVCPPQFLDVSSEILKKCGGLPLAIITVASILACRPTRLKEEWEQIQDCLVASQAPTNSSLTDMMHILDLSYMFLPPHLKACFLYLGTYPEDYEISKDELVRKWVAEGFVSGPIRRSAWDVAESYLNELVNSSMIQLAYRHYLSYDKAPYYKVHDMMLDLILKRCMEDNFLRLVHDPHAKAEFEVKVRRLTVHRTYDDVTIDRQLSQVRSLSLFRAGCVPPSLSELRFLRVLCLLGFPRHKAERIDLTCVSQLSQLRCLVVAREAWDEKEPECRVVLPNQVRSMHRLETLEIRCLHVLSIPADIVHLPCLSHLIVSLKMLPDGIAKVKTLRTLRRFRLPADPSGIVIGSLGELTSLTQLSLDCCVEGSTRECIPMTTAWMAAWRSSLLKLGNLRLFSVSSYPNSCCVDAQISSWVLPPFPSLEVLDVAGWTFSRVPRWIGARDNLHTLSFGVEEISNMMWDDVSTMGMLPNLIKLDLRVEGDFPVEGIVIGGSTGFKLLRNFSLQIKNTSHLAFKAAAMPNLRELELIVDPNECDRATTPVGLEHLACLQQIQVSGARGYTQTLPQNVEACFEAFCAMFLEAISGLPTQPAFDSSYVEVYRPWVEEDN